MASDLRARLANAAAQLKADGHAEHAAAVEAVLAPGGWNSLRSQGGAGKTTSSLPISMLEPLRDRLKAEADRKDVTLGALASEGLRAVADGTWAVPQPPARKPRGSQPDGWRVNLNVRVDDEARAQVERMLPELSEELGARVSLGHVVVSYLRDQLGVEDD